MKSRLNAGVLFLYYWELGFSRGLTVFDLFAPCIFNRVLSLQRKLAKIEKREADETAALENMVHMVEKNLELTTVITISQMM